jgi:hypothetical protein
MKKLIITIVLSLCVAIPASAFYYDNALANLWNSRKDLQKAFPGDPTTNTKLEAWAKKYGWKETPDLYNYYPDKAIVERIIDNKTNDRITALENQIAELTAKINQLQPSQTTTIIQPAEGTWRNCVLHGGLNQKDNNAITCEITDSDQATYYNEGRFNIKVLTK